MKKFVLNEEQKKLVQEHMYVADTVVKTFLIGKQRGSLAPRYYIDDALQDGYLSLCKAAHYYDKSRGIDFGAYAHKVVHNDVISHILKDYPSKEEELDLNIMDKEQISDTVSSETESNDFVNNIMRIIKERKAIYDKKHPFAYDIFKMKIFNRISNEEISEMLSLTKKEIARLYDLAEKDLQRYCRKNLQFAAIAA